MTLAGLGCAAGVSTMFAPRPRIGLPDQGKTFGTTVADLNGDHRLDVFLSRHHEKALVFLARPQGIRFRSLPSGDNLPMFSDQHGAAAADFDGDGDRDLYVTVGGGRPNRLLQNDGNAAFVDVAPMWPALVDTAGRGRGALWVELDGSPPPELLVLNYLSPPRLFAWTPGFMDWSDRLLAPANPPWIVAGAAADVDGDGDTDLCVAGLTVALLINDGRGNFHDVLLASGARPPLGTRLVAFADVNSDARVDLVFGVTAPAQMAVALNQTEPGGEAKFSPATRLDLEFSHEMTSFVLQDLDNDGWLDLYVAQHDEIHNHANLVAHGRGDGSFEARGPTWGALADVRSQSTNAWAADFDSDGDLDILATGGKGEIVDARGVLQFYENRTPLLGITVELLAPAHGLGARLELVAGSRTIVRQVQPVANPWNSTILPAHFGLGGAMGPFALTVQWPDGTHDEFILPDAGRSYRLRPGGAFDG